jgi:hypothetical protein
MPAPNSGSWAGLLVCAERTIKVSITLNVAKNGTLTGEYSITDEKYAEADSSGKLTGTYADDLVTFQLDQGEGYKASFHGQVHPAPPNNQQVLSGYVLAFRGSITEAGVLVLFSQLPTDQSLGGWDGSSA